MDFAAAESAILNAARQHGWTVESRLWKQGAPEMHFLRRTGTGTRKLYLSAGIHGDEPASMLALA